MLIELGLVCVASCLVYIWWRALSHPPNFPKGPRGLFIIGNLHQMTSEPHKAFIEMKKIYGDIFSLKLGTFRAVVLNNYKDIRDAFSQNVFSGRPEIEERHDRCGLIFNVGHSWMEQRRFVLKTLRDFGFGKKSMEGIVHGEITELIESLRKSAGKPIQKQNRFNAVVLNALWMIVSGQRHAHDDPILQNLTQLLTTTLSKGKAVAIFLFFPWIYKLARKVPGSYCQLRVVAAEKNMGFVKNAIAEHQLTFKEDEPPRDLIDVYLSEIKKTSDPNSSFYGEEGYKNMCISLYDLFLAGSETTSTTLSWIFLVLAMHPEKQEKMFKEIEQVVGLSRLPTLNDRPLMPYTESVIHETMRYSSMVPLAGFHSTTEDTNFKGNFIPKGTIILPNLYNANRDATFWTNAEEFIPERFLSDDEKSVVKKEALLPFSFGKRICLGIALALDELFLFTSSLFQTFRVAEDPNGERLKVDYYPSSVLIPKPQDMVLYERNMEENPTPQNNLKREKSFFL